jgi:glutathione S-transferase
MRVFGDVGSGNCYKIQLLLNLLDIDYEWVSIDILKGETRTPEYLARNANGKIPLLEYAPGAYLAESNAILHYLAEGSPYLPTDRLAHAQVLQWMFFEQYSHEPCIAVARFYILYLKDREGRRAELEKLKERGYAALKVMESRLAQSPFLVGETPTIADLSLFAYTHVAHEGDFSLDDFPAIRAWIGAIEALPRFRPMGRRGPSETKEAR